MSQLDIPLSLHSRYSLNRVEWQLVAGITANERRLTGIIKMYDRLAIRSFAKPSAPRWWAASCTRRGMAHHAKAVRAPASERPPGCRRLTFALIHTQRFSAMDQAAIF